MEWNILIYIQVPPWQNYSLLTTLEPCDTSLNFFLKVWLKGLLPFNLLQPPVCSYLIALCSYLLAYTNHSTLSILFLKHILYLLWRLSGFYSLSLRKSFVGGAVSVTVHGTETSLWAKKVFLKPTSGDSYFLLGIFKLAKWWWQGKVKQEAIGRERGTDRGKALMSLPGENKTLSLT